MKRHHAIATSLLFALSLLLLQAPTPLRAQAADGAALPASREFAAFYRPIGSWTGQIFLPLVE